MSLFPVLWKLALRAVSRCPPKRADLHLAKSNRKWRRLSVVLYFGFIYHPLNSENNCTTKLPARWKSSSSKWVKTHQTGHKPDKSYFLHQRPPLLPWQPANHHETFQALGSSCMVQGSPEKQSLTSSTRNCSPSPRMGSWVMLRAGEEVPAEFPSGCTPQP